MKNSWIRNILLYTALAVSLVLLDIVLDKLISDPESMNLTHAFLAALVIMASVIHLQRIIRYRKKAEEALRQAFETANNLVHERTLALEEANQALQKEISEHKLAESARAESLMQAQTARQRAESLAREVQVSNNVLNALIDTLPVGLVVVDLDGEIVLANLHARNISGGLIDGETNNLLADDHIRHSNGAEFSPEERPLNRALLEGQSTVSQEMLLIHDDGSRTYLLTAAGPVKDQNGQIVSAVMIIQDITQIKTMEQALRASEETARALMDASTESALLVDVQGVILAANRTAARRLNATPEMIVGKAINELFPPEVAERRRVFMDQVLHIGRPAHFEDERDGILFASDIHPIFDLDGKIFRLAVFGQDITEQKRTEQTIRASEEKFATVFHHSPDAISIIRIADNTLLDVNHSFEILSGKSRAQLVGQTWQSQSLTPSEDQYHQMVALLEKNKSLSNFEMDTLSRRDGHRHTYLVSLIPITINSEACLLSITHDITERKLSEETDRKSVV